MRGADGVQAMDDLVLLATAVLTFSLLFGFLAGAFAAREERVRGERLQDLADGLLAAVLRDPRWTDGPGQIRVAALMAEGADSLRPFTADHPFEVVLWSPGGGSRWTIADGAPVGDRRTAATAAGLLTDSVVPGRVAATVWEV